MTLINKDTIFTANDRIMQLNEIDTDVVKLLQSAGLAIRALTSPITVSADDPIRHTSLDQRKEPFTASTSQYFTLLSSIDVRLRRQIYALEEADILTAEATTKETQANLVVPSNLPATGNLTSTPSSKQVGGNKGVIIGGGIGSLDVGWLNSRNDNVGKEMEAELWEEAKRFLQGLNDRKARGDESVNFQIEGGANASNPPEEWSNNENLP